MYLFSLIMAAATVMVVIYYLFTQGKSPGIETFPLNYAAQIPKNTPLEEQTEQVMEE